MPIITERLAAHCLYLEHDEARILLDCGCSEGGLYENDAAREAATAAEQAYLKRLEELAPELTLIVLSHPSPQYIGSYPLLATKLRLSPACVVYASPPTASLGRLALQEWVYQRSLEEDSGLEANHIVARSTAHEGSTGLEGWKLSLQQVNDAFGRVTLIRFNSPSLLAGRNAPLTLLASRAGLSLGGTLWTFRSPTSDDVVYAPIWNHLKEKMVDGATSITAAAGSAHRGRKRGFLLIGPDRSKIISPKSKARNAAILDLINNTLQQARSILIPMDASTRVVELLILLSQHWAFSKIPHPLCLVTHTSKNLSLSLANNLDFVGSTLPGAQAAATLDFSNVLRFETLAELYAALPPNQPRLILVAPASLAYGFSRLAFADFAEQAGNVVLLTEKGEKGSLANWLYERWEANQDVQKTHYGNEGGRIGSLTVLSGSITMTVRFCCSLVGIKKLKAQQMKRRDYLVGHELVKHNEAVAAETDRLAKAKALADRRQRVREARDAAESDTSSDEDEVAVDGQLDGTGIGRARGDMTDVGSRRYGDFTDVDGAGTGVGGFDIYVRHAPTRRFPFVEKRTRVDAYGEVIDIAGWLARGKAAAESIDNNAAAQLALGKRKREEEEEAARATIETKPHRFVVEKRKVNLRCSVFVVDLEGQADGRALKTLVPLMNPRKLILLGNDPDATADFQAACNASAAMTREVYAPSFGKQLQIGEDVRSYTVRLDDALLSAVPLKKVADYEVGRVLANVGFSEEASIPSLVTSASILATGTASQSGRAPVPADQGASNDAEESELPPLSTALFIGDVKLAALRSLLNAANIPAVYAGEGVLLCGPLPKPAAAPKIKDPRSRVKATRTERTPEVDEDPYGGVEDRVVVRKEGDGRLLVEGSPGGTFFAVRTVLYSQHL